MKKAGTVAPSRSGYFKENFESTDRISRLLLHRDFGETIQGIRNAQQASSREFATWLHSKNANGSDI